MALTECQSGVNSEISELSAGQDRAGGHAWRRAVAPCHSDPTPARDTSRAPRHGPPRRMHLARHARR
jgi:hypothetical protein